METWNLPIISISVYLCYFGKVEAGSLDVKDLGYNGTWDEFCDSSKIAEDYANYTDHDLMRMRIVICDLKENNLINRNNMAPLAAYKYCETVRSHIEDFYKRLKDKFSLHFLQRTGTMPTTARPSDECYSKTIDVFHRECTGKRNPCTRMFQSLLSATCVKAGISTKDISRYIVEVCDGKYLSDNIDWVSISMCLRSYRD